MYACGSLLPQAESQTTAARRGRRRFTGHQCTGLSGETRSLSFPAVPAADDRLEQYARLVVELGVNVQPGQTLAVNCLLEHAPLARAIARAAYRVGAAYVDVLYGDQRVRRAHIEAADIGLLGWSPPWLVQRLVDLGCSGGAICSITGNPEPEVFADLDGERVAAARMQEVGKASLALTDGLANWSIVAYPNPGWAATVLG